jgi:NAD(P)-dependent dehydrogenase (short-subunit alcohol dehydrogenase family)
VTGFSVTDRVALVTGASSGLGRHFALVLARAGARVAITGRRSERLDELAREIAADGGRAAPIVMDVTDAASVRDGVVAAEAALGPLAILVNNAGVAVSKPLLEHTEADWDLVVDTDLKGAWLVAQETARRMVQAGRGGSIVNIASMLGEIAKGGVPSYCAAKAGLVHLTRAMAIELARHKIRVNALCPGYFVSEMTEAFLASPDGLAMLGRIPQRRIGRADELDGALLLLASDAGAYMTGSIITVDGGHSLVGA